MGRKHSMARRLWRFVFVSMAAAMLVLHASVAYAQGEVTMRHTTIDGGGGKSTTARFSLTATIAQPDAAELQSGKFTLIGGFWTPLGLDPVGGVEDFMLIMPFVVRQQSDAR